MMHIKEWLKTEEVKKMREENTLGQNMTQDFFRDPLRSIIYDPTLMYAPADGVVLYAMENVKPDDFLEIKGKDFSLKEMLHDEDYDKPSLVVGIFMTSYDVHVNRVPLDAYYLEERSTNFIFTHNISMLIVEHDLFTEFNYDKKGLSYLQSNERKVNIFYCPEIRGKYYVVQIGDKDIDVISNWHKGNHLMQGHRFGQVRWGSQCDLVIPLTNPDVHYELLVKKMQHVESGIDPIIKIHKEQ
jgi:phosphatidylserine decarboxylase